MKSTIFVSIMAVSFRWQSVTAANAGNYFSTTIRARQSSPVAAGRATMLMPARNLPDGTTLLGRLAKNKDPETRLATRLKNEQERHQVFLYLQPMIERERLSETRQGSVASRLK